MNTEDMIEWIKSLVYDKEISIETIKSFLDDDKEHESTLLNLYEDFVDQSRSEKIEFTKKAVEHAIDELEFEERLRKRAASLPKTEK